MDCKGIYFFPLIRCIFLFLQEEPFFSKGYGGEWDRGIVLCVKSCFFHDKEAVGGKQHIKTLIVSCC